MFQLIHYIKETHFSVYLIVYSLKTLPLGLYEINYRALDENLGQIWLIYMDLIDNGMK